MTNAWSLLYDAMNKDELNLNDIGNITLYDTDSFIAAAGDDHISFNLDMTCLLYTSPSPRDRTRSRMPSSA